LVVEISQSNSVGNEGAEEWRSGRVKSVSRTYGGESDFEYTIVYIENGNVTEENCIPERRIRFPRPPPRVTKPPSSNSVASVIEPTAASKSSTSTESPLKQGRQVKFNTNSASTAAATAPLAKVKSQQEIDDEKAIQSVRIEANFQGKGKWYKGRILHEHEAEETLDILYDDGDIEYEVPLKHVKLIEEKSTSKKATSSNLIPINDFTMSFQVNSLVEFRDSQSNPARWTKGRINTLNVEQMLADVKLISDNSIQKAISWQDMRLLKVNIPADSVDNVAVATKVPATATTTANDATANNGGDSSPSTMSHNDLNNLAALLKKKNMTIADLQLTLDSIKTSNANDSEANNSSLGGRRVVTANSNAALATGGSGIQPQPPKQSMRPSSSGAKRSRSANNALSTAANGSDGATSSNFLEKSEILTYFDLEMEILKASNEELSSKVHFLGEKLNLVLNEIVGMKKREDILVEEIRLLKIANEELGDQFEHHQQRS
jgi:hypothetical protein